VLLAGTITLVLTAEQRLGRPAGRLDAMPRRVYHADHTAHLRQRLAQRALHGLAGLVLAAIGAGATAIVASRANGKWTSLVTITWIAGAVAAAVAVLYLLATLLLWGIYRRRRAELDAAGAEANGELHARIANLRRDGSD